jgi:hypothetical protein
MAGKTTDGTKRILRCKVMEMVKEGQITLEKRRTDKSQLSPSEKDIRQIPNGA